MLKSRKMKAVLIGIVAILLILLFPIPDSDASMDDGGTRGYTALTYQMVRWNRIMPSEEVYDKFEKRFTFWKNLCMDDFVLRFVGRKQAAF